MTKKLKKMLEKIIGYQDESLLDYIHEQGFKQTYAVDNYICFEKERYSLLYDTKNKTIVEIKLE